MQKKIITAVQNFFLPILIIVPGVAVRLYKLTETFHFTYDEEIIAFVGKRIFINSHIPLIGGVTPMHIHVAPYFYWISGTILFFSNLNPTGWGVVAALFSAVVMCLLYKTGTTFFNRQVGLISAFLYSFSFYQNIFDRHYWGLMFNGFFSLLSLYSLFQYLSTHKKIYLIPLAIVFFLSFHFDPSNLVLYLLIGSVLFFSKYKKVSSYFSIDSSKLQNIPAILLLVGVFFLIYKTPMPRGP